MIIKAVGKRSREYDFEDGKKVAIVDHFDGIGNYQFTDLIVNGMRDVRQGSTIECIMISSMLNVEEMKELLRVHSRLSEESIERLLNSV